MIILRRIPSISALFTRESRVFPFFSSNFPRICSNFVHTGAFLHYPLTDLLYPLPFFHWIEERRVSEHSSPSSLPSLIPTLECVECMEECAIPTAVAHFHLSSLISELFLSCHFSIVTSQSFLNTNREILPRVYPLLSQFQFQAL